eukprot:m51a1_g6422 putative protein clp1 homolog (1172) ;mRNA; f:311912-316619
MAESGGQTVEQPSGDVQVQVPAQHELRIDTQQSFLVVYLVSGAATCFGTPLDPATGYEFPPSTRSSLFSQEGCTLSLSDASLGAVTPETSALEHARLYGELWGQSESGQQQAADGPVVLVAGPTDTGKSTLCRALVSTAAAAGRTPIFVDVDVGQGSITVPGSLAASLVGSPLPVVDGIAGLCDLVPPLVLFFGHASPDSPASFGRSSIRTLPSYKAAVVALAAIVKSKLDSDPALKRSGAVINTCGWVDSTGYDLLVLTADAFGANNVVVLGDQQLHDRFAQKVPGAAGALLHWVPRSPAVAVRSAVSRRSSRQARIREYFYGFRNNLIPFHTTIPFSDAHFFRLYNLPQEPTPDALPRVEELPVTADLLTNALAAVVYCQDISEIVASTVAGFVVIEQVDVVNQALTVLSPSPLPFPSTVFVVGSIHAHVEGGIEFEQLRVTIANDDPPYVPTAPSDFDDPQQQQPQPPLTKRCRVERQAASEAAPAPQVPPDQDDRPLVAQLLNEPVQVSLIPATFQLRYGRPVNLRPGSTLKKLLESVPGLVLSGTPGTVTYTAHVPSTRPPTDGIPVVSESGAQSAAETMCSFAALWAEPVGNGRLVVAALPSVSSGVYLLDADNAHCQRALAATLASKGTKAMFGREQIERIFAVAERAVSNPPVPDAVGTVWNNICDVQLSFSALFPVSACPPAPETVTLQRIISALSPQTPPSVVPTDASRAAIEHVRQLLFAFSLVFDERSKREAAAATAAAAAAAAPLSPVPSRIESPPPVAYRDYRYISDWASNGKTPVYVADSSATHARARVTPDVEKDQQAETRIFLSALPKWLRQTVEKICDNSGKPTEDVLRIKADTGSPVSVVFAPRVRGLRTVQLPSLAIEERQEAGASDVQYGEVKEAVDALRENLEHSLRREVDEPFTTPGSNRVFIPSTMCTVSCLRWWNGKVSGLVYKSARLAGQAAPMLEDVVAAVRQGKSVLIIGPQGSGKTTLLRELCKDVSGQRRTVIVDSRGLIAGMDVSPHPYCGRATRITVEATDRQSALLSSCVPDYVAQTIVVDEVVSRDDVVALRVAARDRSVSILAGTRVTDLATLLEDPDLADLVGGAFPPGQQSHRAAKTIFDIIVEMKNEVDVVIHANAASSIDTILGGQQSCQAERRWTNESGVIFSRTEALVKL